MGRVGVEPSGTAFNSLIQLEHEKAKKSVYQCWSDRHSRYISFLFKKSQGRFSAFIRLISEVPIDYNLEVAQSEKTLVLEMLLCEFFKVIWQYRK
jgi:glutaminase